MFEVTRRHIMRHLARTQDKLRRWRVTSEVRIEEDGEAAHKILDYVRSREHPLLVMGTHAVASMERFLLGSVAEGVFRQAPCPVITVGPLAQTESDLDVGFEKLLFATDFNDTSIAAVPLIQTLQEPCKAGLRVLHVTSKDFSRNEEEDNQFDPVRVALGGTEKREFVTLHGDDISQAVVNEAERYPADLLIRVFGEPRPGRHI